MSIVTLTTDLGTVDHYSASLKAAILSRTQTVQLIDITHQIDPFDIVQASYVLGNCYQDFPKGTIHIIAVMLFHSEQNDLIIFEKNGHFFIGPDNGVFSLLFPEINSSRIYFLQSDEPSKLPFFASIAHGVAYVQSGLDLQEIGTTNYEVKTNINLHPVMNASGIRGTVIYVDNFDNVIINVKKKDFEELRTGREFAIYFKPNNPITYITKDYNEVPVGQVLCRFNSNGFMEIGINMGKASSLLGLVKGETIQIEFY